jgi:hypothetical protein
MNFIALRYQQGQALPANKSARPGYQDFLHGV